MKGDEFLSYHPFLGEVYEYLEGQIDPIMEDMEQFKEEVPVSLAYLIDESAVSELETCEGDIEKIMKIVAEDLNITIKLLQDGIVK
jgi:DNA-binding ferritin-like protein